MWNIFQQPTLLIIVAAIVFFAQRIFRWVNVDKCPNTYLLIPLLIVGLAFGIDYVVKSDTERINSLISTVRKAIIQEDADTVEENMKADYSDAYHRSRDVAISHLHSLFQLAPIKSAKIMQKEMEINGRSAILKIKAFLYFEPDAPLSIATIVFSLDLEKNADKDWLIAGSEFLELNNHPVGWDDLP